MFCPGRLLTTAALLLLLPGSGRPQVSTLDTRPEYSRIVGLWFAAQHEPDGDMLDLFQVFTADRRWAASAVSRDKAGKVTTRTATGTFTMFSTGRDSYVLSSSTLDWSPFYRCVEKQACTRTAPLEVVDGRVDLRDANHLSFSMPGGFEQAERLQQAPIEATTPVAHVLMLTATGQPSSAPPPPGLDAEPRKTHRGNCDDLQQTRICTTNDGHMTTSKGRVQDLHAIS